MKILLTGGGTGGHLVPLLSIISEIKKRDAEAEFLFVGPKSDFNDVLKADNIEVREISAGKIRRYFSWENFSDIFRILVGTDQALFYILRFKPDVVFSKGGFGAVPVVWAAWLLRIPVMSHESDTVPGLANKLIGKWATKIFVAFPEAEKHFQKNKVIISGNPIRKDILSGDRRKAQDFFGFNEKLPVLLVFGGSQGAQHINDILFKALPNLLPDFQVIHICGTKNFEEIKQKTSGLELANKERYKVYPYLGEEMKDAFALADFVVSRAGANSLSEIIALEKLSLIIPLSSAANNHQYYNAKYFADQKMVLMAEEKDLDIDEFISKLKELRERKNELVENLRKYNFSSGDKSPEEIIAEEIVRVV